MAHYLGVSCVLALGFKSVAIFSFAIYGQGRNPGYRSWGKGARRLRTESGRLELLYLDHQRTGEFKPSQSDREGLWI